MNEPMTTYITQPLLARFPILRFFEFDGATEDYGPIKGLYLSLAISLVRDNRHWNRETEDSLRWLLESRKAHLRGRLIFNPSRMPFPREAKPTV